MGRSWFGRSAGQRQVRLYRGNDRGSTWARTEREVEERRRAVKGKGNGNGNGGCQMHATCAQARVSR